MNENNQSSEQDQSEELPEAIKQVIQADDHEITITHQSISD